MQCCKQSRKWYNVGDFDMCMLDEIAASRDEIYAIARKHKTEKLWVFGSCARSDIDTQICRTQFGQKNFNKEKLIW